jgi:transcriptional regulator with XRE-family HTH domain
MIVRKLRLQRGWTQEHLAELTGLSVRSIQRFERGQGASLETLNSLAAVFEVDRSLLKPGDAPMPDTSPVTPEEENAIQYVKGIKEFYSHLFMYVLFVTVFGFALGFKHPFIFWGSIGWGVGVLVHGLNAFEVINLFGPNWERRQIEKRLGRPL